MKPCNRFHFEDVERGDILYLQKDSEGDEPGLTIKVLSTFDGRRFGQQVGAWNGKVYYLDDYDIVRSV